MWRRLFIYFCVSAFLTYLYLVTPELNVATHRLVASWIGFVWNSDIIGLISFSAITMGIIFIGLIFLFGLKSKRR